MGVSPVGASCCCRVEGLRVGVWGSVLGILGAGGAGAGGPMGGLRGTPTPAKFAMGVSPAVVDDPGGSCIAGFTFESRKLRF